MRVASVRAARRRLVKLFKKSNSKFYRYGFTVRGCRYRGSTQETKSVRALQIASRRLASATENTDPLPSKPPVLGELAGRFLDWVNHSRLEEKTKRFYRNGWQVTCVAAVCINQITSDCAEQLTSRPRRQMQLCFTNVATNAAQAEEWQVICHAP